MADEFPIIRAGRLEKAARECPLLDGDHEWADCCSRRFHPLGRRVAGDDDLALDVLQESWIQILRAMHKYCGGSPGCAWVRVIVENSARRPLRKRNRTPAVPVDAESMPPEDPGTTPETLIWDAQRLRLLREMIELLPETYSEILTLRYGRDLSYDQISDILHLSKTNARSRLSRAVAALRKIIDARLEENAILGDPPVPRPTTRRRESGSASAKRASHQRTAPGG